jgi:hypothetical protein
MKRIHIVALMSLVVAVPAAAAGTFFSGSAKPCFLADNAGYRLSDGVPADFTIRIDNAAENPDLRMQQVDDPAGADFVLVDDEDAGNLCQDAKNIKTVKLDKGAEGSKLAKKPDVTIALSRAPADLKIYVHSARYSAESAAALFAAMWRNGRTAGIGGTVAARD